MHCWRWKNETNRRYEMFTAENRKMCWGVFRTGRDCQSALWKGLVWMPKGSTKIKEQYLTNKMKIACWYIGIGRLIFVYENGVSDRRREISILYEEILVFGVYGWYTGNIQKSIN